jgi:hypothetical protein
MGPARYRAAPSGITLSDRDAATIKGMLERGDRQHDIAAWFGVNGGRIGEIAGARKFSHITPASPLDLPPQGPYPNGRDALAAIQALAQVRAALDLAEQIIRRAI